MRISGKFSLSLHKIFTNVVSLFFIFCFIRRLHLNDKHYFVEPPPREKISSEEISKLGDVRSLVSQVNEAFRK